MPMPGNRARNKYHGAVASLLLAVLAACASSGGGQQPLRTYTNLDGKELTPFLATIFKKADYGTSPCHHARICLETSWKQYDADLRGGARWQARRKYEVWFEPAALQDQYNLHLDLVVEGRPSAASEWVRQPVAPEQDGEYAYLLQEIDRMVKQLGGVQY